VERCSPPLHNLPVREKNQLKHRLPAQFNMTVDVDVSFIISTRPLRQPGREGELQRAEARAHAARVSARRKLKIKTASNASSPRQQSSPFIPSSRSVPVPAGALPLAPDDPEQESDVVDDGTWSSLSISRYSSPLLPSRILSPSLPEWDPSPWHWARGIRVDPFECIPGSNSDIAPVAIDFRMFPHPTQ
jgi:hypothetical protein